MHVHCLKRDEKEMGPDWKGGGKKLKGIWGGEIEFRIYYIKSIFNKIKRGRQREDHGLPKTNLIYIE